MLYISCTLTDKDGCTVRIYGQFRSLTRFYKFLDLKYPGSILRGLHQHDRHLEDLRQFIKSL
jgi:hypothetical protein